MSGETSIELEVHLELRDFLRANYWFFFKKYKVFILLMVVAIAYPIINILGEGAKNPNNNLWGLLIPVGMFTLLLGGTYFSAKRQLTSNKALSEPLRYNFSESGIDSIAPSSSGHTSWSNIYEAYETKHNFLLFISRNMMHTIPKRCFRDREQINAFKDLLRAKLSSKAKLK
jgi:hypothetical protein